MDKQLLNALDNLAVALEMLSETLDKKKGESKTPTGSALQSGDFSKQINQINASIKDIKSDTKKILDTQNTILKLQREKKDDKFKAFEGAGKEGNKKNLKDGISVILLIAGSVIAIGLAFKLIGTVDWKSVFAISIALPMIAFAFEKIGNIKNLTPGRVFVVGLALIGISVAIVLASRVLTGVVPIGLFQAMTVIFIATAFGAAAFGIGSLLRAFKDIKMTDALKASMVLPVVLLAVSIAITASSFVLQSVRPIGLFQAFTAILIAAAFGAMSYGLGALIGGLKGVDPATALTAGIVIPIVMIALSLAIVGASWYFSAIRPIGLFQALTAILISAVFVVLSYAVKPLMQGIKGSNPKDIVLGTIAILALTGAVVAASYLLALMQPVSFGQLIDFVFSSIAIAISTVIMALAVRFIGAIGNPAQYIQGGISVVVLATTIAISSLILSIGNYTKYPSLDWSIGVGLSLGFFGLAAILLGSQVMNPFFYAGLGVILVVSGTIVATSYVLSTGNYDTYPSPSWALGVGFSLGFFGAGAVLLGTQVMNPFFYAGLGMILVVAVTIVAVSFIFEQGSYKVYPPMSWLLPSMLVIGTFAALSVMLGILSPFIFSGSVAALLIAGVIYSIDLVFSSGEYKVYPPSTWVTPTMILLAEFAALSVAISFVSPFILVGALVLVGVALAIVEIDDIFSKGSYSIFPNKDWVDGTISALSKFQQLMSEQSILGAIGDSVAGLFGASSSDSLISIAETILNIDRLFSLGEFKKYPTQDWVFGVHGSLLQFKFIMGDESLMVDEDAGMSVVVIAQSIGLVSQALSMGDYSKYPKREWIDGTIYALVKFRSILKLLNFDDLGGGGLFSKISSLFGGKSPLEQAISNITLLSIAFEKLGSSMNSFASSIQGMDMDKLATIREMTSNVILLSLMDADMLDDVLDKMEERSGVFAELIKNFDVSKNESTISKPVRATVGVKGGEKSDAQILGEKVDNMTAILADISTVVGSRGTLKTYLNSIKDKQLGGTSNTPSSVNRSDKRLKNIIRNVGKSLSGINIYLFTYTFNPQVIYQGVIAQELLNTPYQDALLVDKNGFYSVDYSKIDVEFKRLKTT